MTNDYQHSLKSASLEVCFVIGYVFIPDLEVASMRGSSDLCLAHVDISLFDSSFELRPNGGFDARNIFTMYRDVLNLLED